MAFINRWRHRAAIGLGATALAMTLLAGAGEAGAQGPPKPPQATTVTSSEKTLSPGEDATFVVICPDGYVLTDTAIHAQTVGGSQRPDIKAAGLRVTREDVSVSTALFDIDNQGGETLEIFVSGRCVRKMVRVKAGGRDAQARLPRNGLVDGAQPPGGGPGKADCGKGRQPIGGHIGQLPLWHPQSFLSSWALLRRVARFKAGRPSALADLADLLVVRALCTSRKARIVKPGGKKRQAPATFARKPRARVVVKSVGRSRTIPAHASATQTSRATARCPRRYTATSFGWRSRDPDVNDPDVRLRRADYPGRRRVSLAVTNTAGAPRTVKVAAVCLAVRVRR